MNLVKAGIAIAFVIVFTDAAGADFFDGNEMAGYCGTAPSIIHGYAAGLIESDRYSAFPILYCVPANATLGQIKDLYCKFLRDNPADRHLDASALLRSAMIKAWPCPQRGDKR